MPRPPRCRRVCSLPAASVFGPVDGGQSTDAIIMGIDEYENLSDKKIYTI